jgi:hypothetical protein
MEGERSDDTVDEERDDFVEVFVSADVSDFQSQIASLKAQLLRTHLHSK